MVRVVSPGGPGTEQLAAWLVGPRDPEDARRAAALELPDYLVPTRVLSIPEIPLTAHGKVDDSALPEPLSSPSGPSGPSGPSDTAGSAPSTEAERAVCSVMGEVLGVAETRMDDDFFALGGHSLLAVTLIGRLREDAGLHLPLRAVFESPTPAGLLAAAGRAPDPAEGPDGAAGAEDTVSAAPVSLRDWVAGHPRRPGEPMPLTAGQARLWFLNQLEPGSAEYNVVLRMRLEGALEPAALEEALRDVVGRHEVLRTTYPEAHGVPAQQVEPVPERLFGHGPVDPSAGFDLTRELPLRAALVPEGEGRWRLELVIHHIATDGASLGPLLRDLATAYAARVSSGRALRRPLAVQMSDVARSQQARGAQPGADQALDRWVHRLRGIPDELELPADGRRRDAAAQPAGLYRFEIPGEVAERLGQLAASRSASGFHAWLAALAGYLRRLGAGEDVVIGSPSAGRSDPEVADLVGYFVNTLPLRMPLQDGGLNLAETVDLARRVTLEALEDQAVPFERIVEELSPERRLGRHPLFQTMLSYEEPADLMPEFPGVRATALPSESTGNAKVDLSLTLRPRGGDDQAVDALVEYNSALFSEPAARGLMDRWLLFLRETTEAPDRPLAHAPLTGAGTTLHPWTTAHETEPMLEVFAGTVRHRPRSTALVDGTESIDYARLEKRVEDLAAGLRARDVRPGDPVALCLPRSVDTVAALLAVWRAGAVAVPVDATLPTARVAAMIADAGTRLVLHGPRTGPAPGGSTADGSTAGVSTPEGSTADVASQAAAQAGLDPDRLVGTDELVADAPAGPDASAGHGAPGSVGAPAPEDPAYVVFTSGTTGRPKGVQVPHGALAHLLASHRATVMAGEREEPARMAHTTGVGFDAAMDPVLWAVAGHEVHVVGEETRRDPEALVAYFRAHRISAWETTPSYVSALVSTTDLAGYLDDPGTPDVTLLLGGEPVDPELWSWLQRRHTTRSWNLYGPTEAGVDSLVANVAEDPAPELGAPTAGMHAYVLDARLQPVPVGSRGELWLAGPQVAHGYRGRPGETAARFVPDPFAADGSRMYRTGDVVVARAATGTERAPERLRVRMLGRADGQVKIRGYRVEPAEVESLIRSTGAAAQAVVRARDTGQGTTLVAWVVPPSGTGDAADGHEAAVVSVLQARLPAYMVPTAVSVISRIPLTANGKVDEAALPEPTARRGAGRAPRGEAERAVASAFAEVLGVDEVSADDSFFDLGGHSFLAQPAIAAVNAALGTSLPVRSIFQAPTVAALALQSAEEAQDPPAVAESLRPSLTLRAEAEGDPLFMVHPGSGLAWAYSALAARLDTGRPLVGLQMGGIAPDAAEEAEPDSLDELVAGYLATIRRIQPEGPYHLAGWSLGGRLAHAIAVALQADGHEVRLLAVLDAYPTGHSMAGVETEQDLWRGFLAANAVVPETGHPLSAASVRDLLQRAGSPLGDVPEVSIGRIVRRFRRIGGLLDDAAVPRFRGDMLLVEATRDVPAGRPGPEAWRPHLTGRLRHHRVPAAHDHLLSSPDSLDLISGALDESLSGRTG